MSGKTWWLLAKFVCVLTLCTSNAAAERPNIVIIQTDDQGWGDVGFHGNRNISTLQLDQLAKRGARFDRFFVCPVCAPTRAELLTGRYHLRGGVSGVSRGAERLNVDERTLANVFKAAGYAMYPRRLRRAASWRPDTSRGILILAKPLHGRYANG